MRVFLHQSSSRSENMPRGGAFGPKVCVTMSPWFTGTEDRQIRLGFSKHRNTGYHLDTHVSADSSRHRHAAIRFQQRCAPLGSHRSALPGAAAGEGAKLCEEHAMDIHGPWTIGGHRVKGSMGHHGTMDLCFR